MSWFLPDYKSYALEVVEFNRIRDGGECKNSEKIRELQASLICEEMDELFEAYCNKDKAEFLKELCDLFIVTSYMLYLNDADNFDDVGMFRPVKGARNIETSLGYMVDLTEDGYYKTLMHYVTGLMTLIDADVNKAMQLVNRNNFSKFVELKEKLNVTYLDYEASEIERQSEGRYKNVTWKLVGNYIVFNDGNGKLMKPLGFKKLNLTGCVKGGVN